MSADSIFWSIAIFAAFFIGLSKTGIPGVGIMAIGLFTLIIPARESAGAVLPLLILADIMAVLAYRKQADWSKLVWLFPWAILGVIVGYFTLGKINDVQTSRLIGLILLVMISLQFAKRLRKKPLQAGVKSADDGMKENKHSPVYTATMGSLAGFTTMVANAAGPIMNLYLIAMKMPKMAFMGTAAWYFFLLNTFKVPFSIDRGLITWQSFLLNVKLAPAVLFGAVIGKYILPKIDQKTFESIALIFTALAAIKLLLK